MSLLALVLYQRRVDEVIVVGGLSVDDLTWLILADSA
jgi:hypothetical protein